MKQIKIIGEAATDYPYLDKLNGIDCQDEFSEYIHNKDLQKKVENGYLEFEYHNGKLYSVTTYDVLEKLSFSEQIELAEYTQGQWSDGIGEGFEQYPCTEINGEDVYISPWQRNQTLIIIAE